jgi:hypothetical protein
LKAAEAAKVKAEVEDCMIEKAVAAVVAQAEIDP